LPHWAKSTVTATRFKKVGLSKLPTSAQVLHASAG
jgi:hypothetical protein